MPPYLLVPDGLLDGELGEVLLLPEDDGLLDGLLLDEPLLDGLLLDGLLLDGLLVEPDVPPPEELLLPSFFIAASHS
jgi:hypothetical protein